MGPDRAGSGPVGEAAAGEGAGEPSATGEPKARSSIARRFAVVVCRGPECGDRRGSRAIYVALEAAIAARGLEGRCELRWQSCFGRCSQGPNVLVREITGSGPEAAVSPPATALYNGVHVMNAAEIVEGHLEAGVVLRSLRRPTSTE